MAGGLRGLFLDRGQHFIVTLADLANRSLGALCTLKPPLEGGQFDRALEFLHGHRFS